MGVIYKLKPEVIDFILEQKKNNPSFSCRKLSSLALSNFKIELSKSSINAIIKEAGLSAPVGRTPKKQKKHIVMPALPILLEDNSSKEVEKKAREEEERLRQAKLDAEIKAREEGLKKAEEERSVQEAQRKAEEERQAKLAEEEIKAKEAQEKARAEEEIKRSKDEAEKKAKAEEERLLQAKLDAEIKAREEGLKKAEEERSVQEAQRKIEEDKLTQEAQRKIGEEGLAKEAQRKIEEAVRRAKEEAEIFGRFDPGKTWEEWVEEVKVKAQLEEGSKKEEPKQKESRQEGLKKAKEAERKAIEETEKKAREEERLHLAKLEEERKRQEAEKKAKAEEERLRQAKLEEERKAREGEIKEGAGISEKYDPKKAWDGWDGAAKKEEPKQEELKKAQEEAEKKAKDEAERKAKEEAEKKAKEEEERLRQAKLEEERKRKEEEEKELVSGAKVFQQIENTGIVLLRSAERLIGASQRIAGTIQQRLGEKDEHLKDVIENLIYLPLVQDKVSKSVVDKLSSYLDELENIKVMNLDISRVIAAALQEVRCAKVILSEGVNLYLDGQLYSVWSSSNIPYDFSTPIHNFKKYINKYFTEDYPFVFFNAPGYDIPSVEFFRLLGALAGTESSIITNLVLYGNKFEELETLPVTQNQGRSFIFGLWPWQFAECRKVKSMGEFRKFHFEAQDSDYYIADIEMELIHPDLQNKLALTGCALKTKLDEKTRLVLLSNFVPGAKSAEELTNVYLNHWPNLEEAFQDYSHKIELFTYTASSGHFFSAENLNLGFDHASSIKDLFKNYLTALDSYVRWHFLPAGYETKEFMEAKKQFYNLNLQLSRNKESCLAGFVLPPEYAWPKDLSYACRRINEKEVYTSDGLKLYINPG